MDNAPATVLHLYGPVASEKGVVEDPAIDLLKGMAWTHEDLSEEVPAPGGGFCVKAHSPRNPRL